VLSMGRPLLTNIALCLRGRGRGRVGVVGVGGAAVAVGDIGVGEVIGTAAVGGGISIIWCCSNVRVSTMCTRWVC
jgi:hypothetical protein